MVVGGRVVWLGQMVPLETSKRENEKQGAFSHGGRV